MTAAPVGRVGIREAGAADAEQVGRCQLACWRETYTGMVDPDRLQALLTDVDDRVERWRQILSTYRGRLVAEDDGVVVGFAAAGAQRDDDLDLGLELYSLYLRRSHQGLGLGHRLLTAAVGDAASSLWVAEPNAHARTFYARHRYVGDGAQKWDDSFGVSEIRMVRSATAG